MPVWNTVSEICELLLNDESLVIADVSDRQRAAVRALHEEIHQRVIGYRPENRFPETEEAKKRNREQYDQYYGALDQYARDQLLGRILLPHQIEAIAKQADSRKFARMGPIVRLMRGHFDDFLKIDKEQHEKIQHDIEVAVEDLNQELLSLERSFRKELIGALDEENQQKLKAAVGDECKHARGSLYLLSKCIGIPKDFIAGNAPKSADANVVPTK